LKQVKRNVALDRNENKKSIGKHHSDIIYRPILSRNCKIVKNCQSYLGFNLPSDLLPNRVKKFDVKYATSGGSFVKYGFTVA